MVGVFLASGTIGSVPIPSYAANYGGFGSNYAEVINPKDAVLNDATKGSEDVKEGKVAIEALLGKVAALKADLVSASV